MSNTSLHHDAAQAQAIAAQAPADDIATNFCDLVSSTLAGGKTLPIDNELLRRVLVAAVRAYSAKIENDDMKGLPLDFRSVTGTEAATAISALMRAADLNLLDMAMWYHRPLDAQAAEQQDIKPAEQTK